LFDKQQEKSNLGNYEKSLPHCEDDQSKTTHQRNYQKNKKEKPITESKKKKDYSFRRRSTVMQIVVDINTGNEHGKQKKADEKRRTARWQVCP
jgi:hypothetical protein